VRVRMIGCDGAASGWSHTAPQALYLIEEDGTTSAPWPATAGYALDLDGERRAQRTATNGYVQVTTARGQAFTVRTWGGVMATGWVTSYGPDRGVAALGPYTYLDMFAPTPRARQLLVGPSRDTFWGLPGGVGLTSFSGAAPRIDLDAVLAVVRRPDASAPIER
jgi:hypothetical protein